MGFMDKVKAQAEQALSVAQQGVSHGQDKLDSMQARRGVDGILRDLGAAFYAHQRTGGAPEPVQSALAALDAYAAANGPIDTAPTARPGDVGAPGATGAPGQSYGQPNAAQPDAAQSYAQPDAAQSYAPPPQAAPSTPAPTFNQPGQYRPPSA